MEQILETWELLPLPPDTYRYVFAKRGEDVSGTWVKGPMQLARWARVMKNYDCYIQLNPTRDRSLFRPATKDISHLQAVLVDFDPSSSDASVNWAAPRAEHFLGELGIPTESLATIDSGRGFQIWILVEPLPIIGEGSFARSLKSFIGDVSRRWGSNHGFRIDPSCSDLCRLARLPGSFNMKTHNPARILKMGVPTPALWLFPFDSEPQNETIESPSVERVSWPQIAATITHAAYDYIMNGREEPGRHRAAVACARSLKDACVPGELALDYLLLGASRCTPALKESDVLRIHKDTFLRRPHEDLRWRSHGLP